VFKTARLPSTNQYSIRVTRVHPRPKNVPLDTPSLEAAKRLKSLQKLFPKKLPAFPRESQSTYWRPNPCNHPSSFILPPSSSPKSAHIAHPVSAPPIGLLATKLVSSTTCKIRVACQGGGG
jgi:hypothetical protein